MALYGVLGDIHGNSEALRVVLAALDERGVRELLCVGDIVGYNADPDECAALVRSRGAQSIAGNHDLIGTGLLGFERCAPNAAYALRRTRRRLAPETAAWLRQLPSSLLVEDRIALVHGGVRDVQQYMTTPRHIRQNAGFLRADLPHAQVCFFGHSHAQRIYRVDGDEVEDLSGEQRYALKRDAVYFINAGSVDAQRKRGHKLAECALFDSLDWTLDFLAVPYDAASTEAKAAVFGYRMNLLSRASHSLRERISAAAWWPLSFQRPSPRPDARKPWK
jgi:predicted phosphodiesterase